MQCSPSFDWNWGKQNDPTACCDQLHPRFLVLQQGKCLRNTPEHVGRITETKISVGGEWLRSLRTTINGGTPPLKLFSYSSCRPKGSRKTSNVLGRFYGLVPDTNYKHLESFVMLRTHSEPRRGEMSHICDISLLRVKNILMLMTCATVNFMFGM